MFFNIYRIKRCYALDDETGFELLDTKDISDLNGKAYYYKHTETGAEVVFLENDSEKLEFSIGFKTPPIDNKGANHVLEHSLLCGVKNIRPRI